MLSFSNNIMLLSGRSRFSKTNSLLDKKVKEKSIIVLFATITMKINNLCLKELFSKFLQLRENLQCLRFILEMIHPRIIREIINK